jgi:hypothetical protein
MYQNLDPLFFVGLWREDDKCKQIAVAGKPLNVSETQEYKK